MNLSLQDNEAVPKIFGGISVILSGDLLQLPPVQQQQVFMKHKKREYQTFQGLLWEYVFHSYKLAVILNLQIYKHTSTDIKIMELWKILTLEDTDTDTNWPKKCANLYLSNHLAGKENSKLVEQLNSEEFLMRAEDLSKDVIINTCNRNCKLMAVLKICVGARFLQAVDFNVADKLINGFTGTIPFIHFNDPIKLLHGERYVRFD